MKKLSTKVKVILSVVGLVGVAAVIPLTNVFYRDMVWASHAISYPTDCALYTSMPAQEITDKFSGQRLAVKEQAQAFFAQCGNKSAIPFIYSNLKHINEIDVLAVFPLLEYRVPFNTTLVAIDYALASLLGEEHDTRAFWRLSNEEKKERMEVFWPQKIKEKTGIEVQRQNLPLEKYPGSLSIH